MRNLDAEPLAPGTEGPGAVALDAGWDAFPADAEPNVVPEILVEAGPDELRASQFFAPRLWLAALIPLLFVAITSYITAVRVADGVSLTGGGVIYEDMFFQPPAIGFLGRSLLPFGVTMASDIGFGYSYSYVLQTSFILGALALLVGLLCAVAVTRRSNDAIYVAGPYLTYSALLTWLLYRDGHYFQNVSDLFPAVLGGLLLPVGLGITAKVAAVYLRNIGWMEVDGGLTYTVADDDVMYGAPGMGGDAAAGEAPAWRHVAHALACPFCGNQKIAHDHPSTCNRCHRNIGLALEMENGAHCSACDGVLVKDAAFCHHCGHWLHGEPGEGVGSELELAS
jgi:hypothetical protein